jgi:hypothetical protein
MKIRNIFIIFLLFVEIIPSAGQGSVFIGEWKLDKEKRIISGTEEMTLVQINISLRNDSLFTTRFYEYSNGGNYSFEENLKLNDKEAEIRIYGMPRKTRASLSDSGDSLYTESLFVFNDGSNESATFTTEKWRVVKHSNQLVMDIINENEGSKITSVNYFTRTR